MKMAWGFVRRNGYTMSEAMKQAWKNIKLKAAMSTRIVRFYFQKIDGTTREAWGTLNRAIIPTHTEGISSRKPNPTVQTYFDTERGEWRCYKRANLISIAI